MRAVHECVEQAIVGWLYVHYWWASSPNQNIAEASAIVKSKVNNWLTRLCQYCDTSCSREIVLTQLV